MTDQILDLFNLSTDGADMSNPGGANNDTINEDDAVDATGEVREKGKKGFLDELGELWDERQYQEEFDLDNCLATMKG